LIKEINTQNSKSPPATGEKTSPATAGDKKTPGAEDTTPPTTEESK